MRYSKSTGGFYSPEIHGAAIPADAVEITATRHAELIAGQAAGKTIGHGADGTPILIDPPAPTLADIRAQAATGMAAWIAHFLEQFTAGVSPAELASWSVKAERARQHLAGVPQPMITAEATLTREPPNVLAKKIVAKSDAYEAIIARITGLRRATEAAIASAKTPEAVAAVLKSARAQAEALAASLGIGTAVS